MVGTGDRNAVFINGGFHAREWISPATVLYLAHQFALNPQGDKDIANLLTKMDFYFLVLANPDGYDYSRLSQSTRLWRKSLSSATDGSTCRGVDLNRNFDFHWAGDGSGSDPCAENYFGPAPFSEPETRAIRDFVMSRLEHIKAYVSFHSYGQNWLYPWLYRNCTAPADDEEDLKILAMAATSRIEKFSRTRYAYGQAGCKLYPASGASGDWMKAVAGVKYSYTVELPDQENGLYGFLLPAFRIRPVAKETLEGIIAFTQELQKHI